MMGERDGGKVVSGERQREAKKRDYHSTKRPDSRQKQHTPTHVTGILSSLLFSSLSLLFFVRPKVLLQQCNIVDALIPEEPPGRQKLDHAVTRRGRERLRGAEVVAATGAEERHGRWVSENVRREERPCRKLCLFDLPVEFFSTLYQYHYRYLLVRFLIPAYISHFREELFVLTSSFSMLEASHLHPPRTRPPRAPPHCRLQQFNVAVSFILPVHKETD